ncbi:hypothetical protein [Cryptosporangium sp. NPDC051539]|uniref:hypothetical protein n=1 Tax=Cryptosporangium sp. NPDC051539 TaxID=3363962 RepID=UPI0037A4C47E
MPYKVLIDPYFVLNGTNLTAYVQKVEVPLEREDLDVTTSGSGGAMEHAKGLEKGTIKITFLDSFGTGEVDAVLFPLYKADAAVTFEARADSDAVSTSNPKWTGLTQVTQYSLGGAVGQAAVKELEWPTSGPTSRAVA